MGTRGGFITAGAESEAARAAGLAEAGGVAGAAGMEEALVVAAGITEQALMTPEHCSQPYAGPALRQSSAKQGKSRPWAGVHQIFSPRRKI